MIERQRPDITIKDPEGTEIFTVPITSDCRRKKKLMEEDCITIKFDSTEAKPMPVGSYVDDEIFGRFFLTEEQLPSWDKGIGGYTYDLRFDAWYKLWALKKNMLTTSIRQIRERTESSWTLTGNLEMHLREVYHNLLTLDFIQRQWIEIQDGKVTNIFCAKREYNETLSRWEVKIYSKYRVEKHVFFRIQYDYEDDGSDYTSSPFVVINQGEDVSQPVRVNADQEEDEYTFDYFGENTPFQIDGIVLAEDWYYDEIDEDEDLLYIYEINPTTGVAAYRYYDAVMIRESGIDYNNTIYQFESVEYPTVKNIKLAMGMSETGGYWWKFDDECATQEERGAQEDLEDAQKVVEQTRTTEDYEEEEKKFVTYNSEEEEEIVTYFVIKSADIPKYQNALTIQYNGTDILSALKKIADTFECEYWVDIEDSGYPHPAFKVYFGKCETGNEKTISCKDYQESGETKPLNAENISVNLNQSDNADKFYIFGSENNIPYSYRKKLTAECVKKFQQNGKDCIYFRVPQISKGYKGFIDGNWFPHESATPQGAFSLQGDTVATASTSMKEKDEVEFVARIGPSIQLNKGAYSITEPALTDFLKKIKAQIFATGNGSYPYDDESDGWYSSLSIGLIGNRYIELARITNSGYYKKDDSPSASVFFRWYGDSFQPSAPQLTTSVGVEKGIYQFGIWGVASTDFGEFNSREGSIEVTEDVTLTLTGTDIGSSTVDIDFNDATYSVKFNPLNKIKPSYVSGDLDSEEMKYFACADSELYDKISVNDEVTIVDSGNIDIPTMYYTTDFDNEASLFRLGAKRLMLPENDDPTNPDFISGDWICYKGAILPQKYVNVGDSKELKEAVILFDNIYPNGKLKVQRAIPEDKETKTDATGNVELYTWGWQQWHLRLVHAATGLEIDFDEQYILSGYELGIRFLPYTDLTPQEQQTKPQAEYQKIYSPTGNPHDKGYYEHVNEEFVLTSDTTVVSGKTYYQKTNGSRLAGMQFSVEFNKKKAPYTPSGLILGYSAIQNPTGNPHDKGYHEYTDGEYVLSSDTSVVSGKTYYQHNIIPTEEGWEVTDGEITYTCDDLNNVFSIVRNNDFGAKLPNDVLYPKEGDACCLINWDVRAMNSLGLITAAERELMNKGFEYAKALKEGNATFTCDMMSNFFFDWFGEHIPINVKSKDGQNDLEAYVRDSADTKDILAYVKNDYDIYRMPDIGQKVKIIHEGLHNGERSTRILGMELKLDKPYDTPKLICGETDIYSRLKQLEKEITKLTN